jgi:hypothetical protein
MEPAEGDHAQLGLWAWNKFALPVILPLVFSSPAMSYISATCPANQSGLKAGGRKPNGTGILKIRAIPRSLIGSDVASACGETKVLAEREGFEPSIQVLARITV